MQIEDIASICHEANRRYCEILGDHSQKPWKEISWAQKQSAMAGVVFVLRYPQAPPSAQHDNWRKDKEKEGWVYGKIKSEENKTHPCLLPYEDLPIEQKVKDYLFQSIAYTLGEIYPKCS